MTDRTPPRAWTPLAVALGGALALAPHPVKAGAEPAALDAGTGWTATTLDLVVTPRPDEGILRVEGAITLRLDAPSSRGPTLFVNPRKNKVGVHFTRAEATGATAVLNDSVPGIVSIRLAHLRFAKPKRRGAEVTVRFACESERQMFQLQVRPDIALASWTEAWYPSPLSREESERGSPCEAAGSTRFLLPKGWRAVSNGRRISSSDFEGRACEDWVTDIPVRRSFAAGPYHAAEVRAGTLDVGVFAIRAAPAVAERKAAVLARALEAMELHYGPYPYPTYAIAEVPDSVRGWAASSEQGFIMVKSSILGDEEDNLPLFAHEAAHGWWGNLVRSKDPGDTFCSESMAEYAAVTAIESLEGSAAAADFLEFSRKGYSPAQCAAGYFRIWRDGGDKSLATLANDKWDHDLSDSKGAWVVHMLRGEVGDSVFFTTLRGVIRSFAGKAISLETLEGAFANTAPSSDIPGFFRQWTHGTRAPVLDVEWWSGADGRGIEFTVRQLQPGPPFRFPLEVEATMRDGTTARHVLDVSERSAAFRRDTPGRVVSLRLDPGRRVLMWRPSYGPRPADAGP